MRADGLHAQRQVGRDGRHGASGHDETQDLELPLRQLRMPRRGLQAQQVRDRGRHVLLAARDAPDGAQQFGGVRAFHHVARRTGTDGPHRVLVLREARVDQHRLVGMVAGHPPQHLDAVAAGHRDVEHHHVTLERGEQAQGVGAAGGFRDDLDVGHGEHLPHADPNQRMVVDDDDSRFRRHRPGFTPSSRRGWGAPARRRRRRAA